MATASGAKVDVQAGEVAKFLAGTRAFQGADSALVKRVAPHAEAKHFTASQPIFRAGQAATHLGFVYDGRASVQQVDAVSGEKRIIQELRKGDHFGEVAALLDSAQPYAVAAETDVTVLLLPKTVYGALISKTSHFSLALAKSMASRLVRASVSSMGSLSPRPAPAPVSAPPPTPAPAAADAGTIRFLKTSSFNITDELVAIAPVSAILQHRFIPLALDGKRLTIGMVEPHNHAAKTELDRILHGIELDIAAISQDDYMASLVRLRLDAGRPKANKSLATEAIAYEKDDQEKEAENRLEIIGTEVVNIVDKILIAGIERGASDIHISEEKSGMRVRYRINGMLHDYREYIPASFSKGMAARIKILAGLDITERRRPQDGRVGLRIGRRDVDFRISTLPANLGEKIVMRMFEAANMMRPIEQIFIERRTMEAVRDALARPYGAIVVAGATGSGKSSTLYGCLHEVKHARPDSNICVVEDPIEYRLQGVTQVQVNHSVGLDFAKVLRAFLRQDPDVIMVGEMRDSETAKIALEAAMTGHLVFSSFHANNAQAAIQRLENFGCNRTMIAQSVALVLVQRLVRRLCKHCAILAPAAAVLVKSLADRGLIERTASVQLPKATGCEHCDNTGYAGRVPVVEALKITEEVATRLMADVRLDEIEKHALGAHSLIPFRQYASFLMARKEVAPGDALLAVAG